MKKTERLEIENRVLKDTIGQMQAVLKEWNQIPEDKRYKTTEMFNCLVQIDHIAGYEKKLKEEMRRESQRKFSSGFQTAAGRSRNGAEGDG